MASKSSRVPIRREVHTFLFAAEKLLSLNPRDAALTPEECHLICEYLTTMSRDHHPWSGHLKSTVASQASSAARPSQRER
jgi:hypothetical protein